MTNSLTVFSRSYSNGVCYFGEHAEIMRIVWGLDKFVKTVRIK